MELGRYKEVTVSMKGQHDFDAVAWWENNKTAFPHLFLLSKKVLSIPATSAPSEHVWSVSSRVLTKKRNRSSPAITTDLMLLKQNNGIMQKHYSTITEDNNAILPGVETNSMNLTGEKLEEFVKTLLDEEDRVEQEK